MREEPVPRIDDATVDSLIAADCSLQALPIEAARIRARNRILYEATARPVLDALAAAGFSGLRTIQDLQRSGTRYVAAVPILVDWLPRATYDALKIDIARMLAPTWVAGVVPVLLREFMREEYDLVGAPNQNAEVLVRMSIADALEHHACDDWYDEFARIAADLRWGAARQPIVLGLGRMRHHPEVVALLIRLADDAEVSAMAVGALARLRPLAARDVFVRFSDDAHPQKRRWARQALKAIDQSSASGT